MQAPWFTSTRGLKMPKKGVQNHPKHGSAHVNTHDNLIIHKAIEIQPENTEKTTFWDDLSVVEDPHSIQDGGDENVIVPESFEDIINFDSETLDNADDIVGPIVNSFPSTIMSTPEWMKTPSDGGVLKMQFSSENTNDGLDMGDSKNVESVSRDLGDLFPSDMQFSLGDGFNLPCSINSLKLSSGICHSSPVSPTNFLEELTPMGRSRSYSDTESEEKSQTKAFLDELERGSQLTAEDKELMETSRKELQAYEFQVLAQDKNNALLTPHELENLPVHGLEFEEGEPKDAQSESKQDNFMSSGNLADIDISSTNDLTRTSMSFISTPTDNAESITKSKEKPKPLLTIPPHLCQSSQEENISASSIISAPSKVSGKPVHKLMNIKRNAGDKTTAETTTTKSSKRSVSTTKVAVSATKVAKETFGTLQATKVKKTSTAVHNKLAGASNRTTKKVQNGSSQLQQNHPSLSSILVSGQQGPEQVIQIGSNTLIPVQLHPSVAETVKQDGGSDGASNGSVLSVGNNVYLTAVPMLLVKDGCLVIPIQQVQQPADTSLGISAAGSDIAADGAAVLAAAENAEASGSILQAENVVSPEDSPQHWVFNESGHHVFSRSNDPNIVYKQTSGVTQSRKAKASSINKQRAGSEEKKWLCNICSQGFSRLYKLKLHVMKHTGEKPYKCSHPGCKWAFTTSFKLKRHEECHLGKKDYVCDIDDCGKKFTTIYNLNTHKKSHARMLSVECPTCHELFLTQRKLDYHMRAEKHGDKESNFTCPHPGCGRKFFSRFCMGSHMRVHIHTEKLPCPQEGCDRVFDKQCRLQQHLRSHTGERPFVCTAPDCFSAFATASKLKRHARKHTNERRWVCQHEGCGKGFLRAEHLRAHQVTHTGDKPFQCNHPDCNARFKCKSSLYVHLKRHAENEAKKDDAKCSSCKNPKTYKSTVNQKNSYNRQLQSALGDLFTMINAEDLESLINSQVDNTQLVTSGGTQLVTSGGTHLVTTAQPQVASVETYLSHNANTLINPSDILSVNLQPSGMTSLLGSGMVVSHADALAQGLVTTTGNITTPTDLRNPVIGIKTVGHQPRSNTTKIKNIPAPTIRTDHLLSARKKRKQLVTQDQTTIEVTQTNPIPGLVQSIKKEVQTSSSESSSPTSTPLVNPNEIVTSRAITFRDPETGAIYVQTQLLQDDPPNPDIYGDSVLCLDSSESTSLGVDMPSILSDAGQELIDSPDILEFTGTTINLQDLE